MHHLQCQCRRCLSTLLFFLLFVVYFIWTSTVFSSIPKFLAAAQFEPPFSVIYFNTSVLNLVENDFHVGAIFQKIIFTKMYHKKQSKQIQIESFASQWLHCVSAYFRGRPIFVVSTKISRPIFDGRTIFEEIRYLQVIFKCC